MKISLNVPGSLSNILRDLNRLSSSTATAYKISFHIFRLLTKYHNWIIAFSGGKDSTLLLHIATRVAEAIKKPKRIIVLYNDTLAELAPIHEWSVSVLNSWRRYMDQIYEIEVETYIGKPELIETFYWRAIVRGYPAPTFKFRWCTELLKINPTRRLLNKLSSKLGSNSVLLVGSRDDESSARSASNRKRALASCPVATCFESFLLHSDYGVAKAAPLRHWHEISVWEFLAKATPPWNEVHRLDSGYELLFKFYGVDKEAIFRMLEKQDKNGKNKRQAYIKARFGCWFCTVSKRHYGFQVLLNKSEYTWLKPLWDLRSLYMIISDIRALRERKIKGYSRLGGLVKEARGLIYSAIGEIIRKSPYGRKMFYDLFEPFETPLGRLTLWEIFYEMEPKETARLIHVLDSNPRSKIITLYDIEDWRTGIDTMLTHIERKIRSEGSKEDLKLLDQAKNLLYNML